MDGHENTAGISTSSEILKPKPENTQLEMKNLSGPRTNEYEKSFPLHWAAVKGKYEDFERVFKNVSEIKKLTEKDWKGNTILIKICHRHVAELAKDTKKDEDNKQELHDSAYSDMDDSNEIVDVIKSYFNFCPCSPKEGNHKTPNQNLLNDDEDSEYSEDSDYWEYSDDSEDSEDSIDSNEAKENEVRHNTKIEKMIKLLMERVTEVTANNTDSKDKITKFVNTKNFEGNTALHYVAMFGFDKLVQLLLNQGAEASSRNEKGNTPLHLLTERRSKEAEECTMHLLEKMANKDILNNEYYSVLGTAMSKFFLASPEMIKLMIDKGCSVSPYLDINKTKQISILHTAVYEETTTNEADFKSFGVFVQALSAEDINRKEYGHTALHIVAYYLQVHFLKYLLAHEKIDLYKTDKDGDSALHLVAQRGWNLGSDECVELLMSKAGSDTQKERLFNLKNKEKRTAFGISVQADSVPLAKAILMSHPRPAQVLDWMNPSLFARIYEKVPEILLPNLNESINYENKNYEANAEKFSANITVLCGVENKGIEKNIQIHRETDYLAKLLESRYVDKDEMETFLSHPVVALFILEKWKKLRALYWTGMFCKILWLISYIAFAIDVFFLSLCNERSKNQDYSPVQGSRCKNDMGSHTYCRWFLVVISIILLAFKMLVSYNTLGFRKILTPIFVIHLLFTVYIGFILTSVCSKGVLDWHYIAIAISVVWIAFIWVWDLRDFPVFGKYADVFFIVMKNFIRFMISFLPLFIGFSIALALILRTNKHFQNLRKNVIKVLVMMLGEINFDDIFGGENKDLYRMYALIIVALFVITVPIVLFNLLLGFTVSDVQALKSKGEMKVRISTLEHIIMIERLVLSPLVQHILSKNILLRFIMQQGYLKQKDKSDKNEKDVWLDKDHFYIEIEMVNIPREIRQNIREISRLHQRTKSKLK